ILRLLRTLREFRIRGVKTNISFLENVINHEEFRKGYVTVNFIGEHPELTVEQPRADRGTKTLRYLAETIINGNPDVKTIDPKKTFLQPKLPDSSSIKSHPNGSKQLLDKLGPKEFSKWVYDKKEILFTDCTMRDAHQSLLATR